MSSLPPYEEGGNWYNSPTQGSQPDYSTPPVYNPAPGYLPPNPTPGYVPPNPAPAPVYMPPTPAPAPVYAQPAPMPIYAQPAPTPVYMVQPQYMAMPVVPLIQAPDPGSGQAVAGMVLGILSLPFLFFYGAFLGILPLLGLIFSIIGLRSRTRKGMAIAGLILSSITLLIAIVVVIVIVVALTSIANGPIY